jgi:hypothetical protein
MQEETNMMALCNGKTATCPKDCPHGVKHVCVTPIDACIQGKEFGKPCRVRVVCESQDKATAIRKAAERKAALIAQADDIRQDAIDDAETEYRHEIENAEEEYSNVVDEIKHDEELDANAD